jgi:hypothetical protein
LISILSNGTVIVIARIRYERDDLDGKFPAILLDVALALR